MNPDIQRIVDSHNRIFAPYNVKLIITNITSTAASTSFSSYDLICKKCCFLDPPRPASICRLCSLIQSSISPFVPSAFVYDLQFHIIDPSLPTPSPDDISAIASLLVTMMDTHK